MQALNDLSSALHAARTFAALATAQHLAAHLRHRRAGRTLDAHDHAAALASLRHIAPAFLAECMDSQVSADAPWLLEPGPDGEPPLYRMD